MALKICQVQKEVYEYYAELIDKNGKPFIVHHMYCKNEQHVSTTNWKLACFKNVVKLCCVLPPEKPNYQ